MTKIANKIESATNRVNRFAKNSYYSLLYNYFPNLNPESVYFYTFHKCASTLFSNYVLRNIAGLRYVDYMHAIYRGKIASSDQVSFESNGFVYGPIRMTTNQGSVPGKIFLDQVSQAEFIKDKIALFFVRDPRDIMVSKYYSFGYSHSISKVSEIANKQLAMRDRILNMTIDEYVLQTAYFEAGQFEKLHRLYKRCHRGTLLTYEEMVTDFDGFAQKFCQHIKVSDKVMEQIYKKSRPMQTEDKSSHRRSGQVEGFRSKLESATIDEINFRLGKVLKLYGYPE